MSIPSDDVIFHGLNHKIRREILELLKAKSRTFSELLNYFNISSGKLNYHLTQIKGFIQKTEGNKYELTSLGLKSLEFLAIIRKEVTGIEQSFVKEAYLAQKGSTKPLIVQGINLGIGALVFLTCITIFLFSVFLSMPDSPVFVWPILLTMLLGEILGLIWTLRVRKSAPAFVERLDKHLKEGDL